MVSNTTAFDIDDKILLSCLLYENEAIVNSRPPATTSPLVE